MNLQLKLKTALEIPPLIIKSTELNKVNQQG